MACWFFAGKLLFSTFGVGFVAGETVLVAAGRERSAASQVIGFFG
jgi:hypothetical protein